MKYFRNRPIMSVVIVVLLLGVCSSCSTTQQTRVPPSTQAEPATSPDTKAPADIGTQAAKVFEARLQADPSDIEALYGKALVLRMEGKNGEAKTALLQILSQKRDFAPAHASLGSILAEEDKMKEARAAFNQSLTFDAANGEANKGLGALELAAGSWEKAITYLTQALKQDQDPYIYADRALAWSELGQYKNAETDYNLAITAIPNEPFLYLDRGRMRARNGATAQALSDFDKVLELEPSYTLVKYYRGQVHDQLLNSAAAIADFEAVIQEKPSYFPVLENLAILYAESGRFSDAGLIMARSWDPIKKNDRALLLATAFRFLDPNKSNRESARQDMEKNQTKIDRSGILYQVSRSYVDSKLEEYVLGLIEKMPKGNEKALAQILMAAACKRSGLNGSAESLALDSKDRFGIDTTEGRLGALIRNESRFIQKQ